MTKSQTPAEKQLLIALTSLQTKFSRSLNPFITAVRVAISTKPGLLSTPETREIPRANRNRAIAPVPAPKSMALVLVLTVAK